MIYIYNPTIYPTMISIRIIHWDEPVLPSTFKLGGGLGGDDQQAVNTAFFCGLETSVILLTKSRVWQMNMLVSTWEYRSSNHATLQPSPPWANIEKINSRTASVGKSLSWIGFYAPLLLIQSSMYRQTPPVVPLFEANAPTVAWDSRCQWHQNNVDIYILYTVHIYTLYNENIKWCAVYIHIYIISITYTII